MSYCANCVAKLEDNAKFCPECGAKTTLEQAPPQSTPVYTQPANTQPAYTQPAYTQPVYEQPVAPAPPAPSIVMCILSLVFAGLLGFIFALVGKSQIKKYVNNGGQITGTAKALKILTTICLIVSIIVMVLEVIWFIQFIFVIVGGVLSNLDQIYVY